MKKSILIFSNGEKIGDGLIKLPLLNEIKKRLPEHKIIWMTNKGRTVYNHELKNIAFKYIDKVIEKADLNIFFWQEISNNYNLNDLKVDFIFDTQKVFFRTLALRRIKSNTFISATASGFFSNKKIKAKDRNSKRQYYLDDLFDLLDLIKKDIVEPDFKISIPNILKENLSKIFNKNHSYIGIAPGAGEKDKIWPIENFIKVGEFFEKKSFILVFFLGPSEENIKKKLKNIFPNSIMPEDIIKNFSGPEIVMGSTNFLKCALSNDSGVSHMLSTNLCPLIKLFGPKDSKKFTPKNNLIHTISASEFGSKKIDKIKTDYVINLINNLLNI